MTSPVDMHNILLDMHNISPTCTTSPGCAVPLPAGTPRGGDVVDVVHVVPKKIVPATYLLSVAVGGTFLLRPVRAMHAPISTHAYPLHNMHNIPKTWHATSRFAFAATSGRGNR